MNQTELRSALALASIYLMRMLGLFMIMPVIAILAPAYPDYSPLLVGLAIGGYGLTQAVMQIPMGMWSDKFGRKPVIIAGLLVFMLGSLVAATAESLWMVVAGRILQGAGAIAGAVMALAADASRENQRAKVMAIIGIAIGFSFYLAMILGPVVATSSGLSGIFYLTALLALAGIPLVFFGVPKISSTAPKGDTLPALTSLKQLSGHASLWRLNTSVLILHCLITLIFVQLPVIFTSHGWLLDEHWSLYLPVLLASVLGMSVLMGMKRRVDGKVLMTLSVWILAVSCAGLFVFADAKIPLLLLVWLFFCGFNYLEANLPAMVSNIAPAGQKGSAMGIYASFQFFGAFLGGTLSGAISEWFGNEAAFLVAAVLCLLWWWVLRGLPSLAPVKRYALVYAAGQTVTELKAALSALAGVNEVSINQSELTVYLKVDAKHFDLHAARKVLS